MNLQEYGFFDYAAPGNGGMELFQLDDYRLLLDEMAAAGMNSLGLGVKWQTTGYRSRLPFLDQLGGCPNIDSDNELMRRVIAEARQRGIKTWLLAAVNCYDAKKFGSTPHAVSDSESGIKLPIRVGFYDSDLPEMVERIPLIFEELVELFQGIDGLVVELENTDMEMPHRIPLYNKWAEKNGRLPFDKLGHPLRGKIFDVPDWRDYTTMSKVNILKRVEAAARGKGFRGAFATVCEVGRMRSYAISQVINLHEFHQQLPDWLMVTYQFEKWHHRHAIMDFCINDPKQESGRVLYLARGVMTWGKWPLPMALEQGWELDVEDIRNYQPTSVWWFGCGSLNDGSVVSLSKLRELGYRDGLETRRALLKKAASLRGEGICIV